MANSEHLAKLAEGVGAWNSWRKKNPNVFPNLREANLEFSDLQEANLQEADLRGANLTDANLRQANLQGTHLVEANLKNAELIGANLKGAVLVDANLNEADLGFADLKNAELRKAKLERASLVKAELEFADIQAANLQKADLTGANLKNALLIDSDLKEAILQAADLDETFLNGADLRGADLSGANLKNAKLSEVRLEGRIYNRTKKNTTLKGSNLEGAYVRDIKFNRWARYQGIKVDGCHGSARFARFAKDQDFIEEFRSKWWRFIAYLVWLVLADCGRSLLLWVFWSITMALAFAFKFYSMGASAFNLDRLTWGLKPMIYYSVVTFTTLGFGDIKPETMEAAWWVMFEVIVGYIMLGGLISIFATKLARRS